MFGSLLLFAGLAHGLALDDSTSCPPAVGPGPGSDSVYVNRSSSTIWPWLQYQSQPNNPPWLNITANGEPLSPGLLVFVPSGTAAKQSAPVIMTDAGDLVWGGPGFGGDGNLTAIINLQVQTLNGTSYLTYWEGIHTTGSNMGHGYGATYFLDDTYSEKFVVCPKLGLNMQSEYSSSSGCEGDLHEQYVTPRGTLLSTAYNITPYDLTPVGGPKDGWLYDSQVYELAIPSGEILFRWSSIEHVNITQSHLPLNGTGVNSSVPWDFFHVNSIQSVNEGPYNAYLINSRHLWTSYLVEQTNGSVIWEFNGANGGDFGAPPAGSKFSWQHDVRLVNVTSKSVSISLFNDNNDGQQAQVPSQQSMALEFQLALPPSKSQTPTVLEHLDSPPPLYADSQGAYAFLPSPAGFATQFVDYGQVPVMQEYGLASDGSDLRWQARFGPGETGVVMSYRAYKTPWFGRPTYAPALAVKSAAGGKCPSGRGYVSWNGATNVTGWAIYEGPTTANLTQTGVVPFRGFETAFNTSAACVQAAAVEGGKQVMRSNVVCS